MERPYRDPRQEGNENRAPDQHFPVFRQNDPAHFENADVFMIVKHHQGNKQKNRAEKVIKKKAVQNLLFADVAENADHHEQRQQQRFEKNVKGKKVGSQKIAADHAQKHQGKNNQRLLPVGIVTNAHHPQQNRQVNGGNQHQGEDVDAKHQFNFRILRPGKTLDRFPAVFADIHLQSRPPQNHQIGKHGKNAHAQNVADPAAAAFAGKRGKQHPEQRHRHNRIDQRSNVFHLSASVQPNNSDNGKTEQHEQQHARNRSRMNAAKKKNHKTERILHRTDDRTFDKHKIHRQPQQTPDHLDRRDNQQFICRSHIIGLLQNVVVVQSVQPAQRTQEKQSQPGRKKRRQP